MPHGSSGNDPTVQNIAGAGSSGLHRNKIQHVQHSMIRASAAWSRCRKGQSFRLPARRDDPTEGSRILPHHLRPDESDTDGPSGNLLVRSIRAWRECAVMGFTSSSTRLYRIAEVTAVTCRMSAAPVEAFCCRWYRALHRGRGRRREGRRSTAQKKRRGRIDMGHRSSAHRTLCCVLYALRY